MGYNPRILLGNRAPISVQFMEKPCVDSHPRIRGFGEPYPDIALYYVVKHGMQSNDMSSGVAWDMLGRRQTLKQVTSSEASSLQK